MATTLAYRTEFDKAFEQLLMAEMLAEETNNIRAIALTHHYKALTNHNMDGDVQKSINHYNDAIAIWRKEGAFALENLSSSLNNLGYLLSEHNRGDEALPYLRESVAIYSSSSEEENSHGIAYPLFNISTVFKNKAMYDSAMVYLERSQAICNKIGEERLWAFINRSMADIYKLTGRRDEAIQSSMEGLRVAFELKEGSQLKLTYLGLYETYEIFGMTTEALAAYKRYVAVRDSVTTTEEIAHITELQQSFEQEKEQMRLASLEAMAAKQEKERNYLQYLVIVLGLAVIYVSIYLAFRLKRTGKFGSVIVFAAFLLSFEFVLVVLDPSIESVTGGIPLWKLGINMGLAVVMAIVHQFAGRRLVGA
jgi:tetratricopeptide (TPR) repeat protein